MIKPTRFLSIAAVALLSACGSDSGTGPTATAPVNLATAFSEMSIPGLATAASLAGGVSTPTTSNLPAGCTYVAVSQNFVCPAVATSGLTVTSNYFLLDAAGHSMSAFDANTVAALRVRNTIAGTLSVSGDSYAIEGQQDQTLTGLQSSTHTLNGTSTLNMSGTRTGATLPGPFTTHSTTTISSLVLPANLSTSRYPASGTVAIDQTTSLAGGSSISSRLVMTFNGTSKVAVTLKVDNLSLPGCTVDLSNGTTTCG
ncbi:MAG: hypothetical protein ABIT20_24620 [Gemmatimonadaceae bacterium]